MRSLFWALVTFYGFSITYEETIEGNVTTTVQTTTVTAKVDHHADILRITCDWPQDEVMEISKKVEALTEDCNEMRGKVVIEKRIHPSTKNVLSLITRLNGSLLIGCSEKAIKVLEYFSNLEVIENNVLGAPALTICLPKKKRQIIDEIELFKKRTKLICSAGTKWSNCFKQKGWIDSVNAFVRSLRLARRIPGRTEPSGELSDKSKELRNMLYGFYIFVSIVCLLLSTCSIFIVIYCLQWHKPRHVRKSRHMLRRRMMRNASVHAEREVYPLTNYAPVASQRSYEELLIHAPPPSNRQQTSLVLVPALTARDLSSSRREQTKTE